MTILSHIPWWDAIHLCQLKTPMAMAHHLVYYAAWTDPLLVFDWHSVLSCMGSNSRLDTGNKIQRTHQQATADETLGFVSLNEAKFPCTDMQSQKWSSRRLLDEAQRVWWSSSQRYGERVHIKWCKISSPPFRLMRQRFVQRYAEPVSIKLIN